MPNVRLHKGLIKRLEAIAIRRYSTRSDVIREACVDYCEKMEHSVPILKEPPDLPLKKKGNVGISSAEVQQDEKPQ